jgi:hypothetical protein
MSKRNQLSYAEQRLVEKAIAMVCARTEDGFAEYAPGWTDAKVAGHVADAEAIVCTRWNVAHVREAAIGKLRPTAPLLEPGPALDLSPLLEAIAALDARVMALAERCARIEEAIVGVKIAELNAIALDAQLAREAATISASILSNASVTKSPAPTGKPRSDTALPAIMMTPGAAHVR